jgi:two-component system chemotaxis response regulator CheB
MQNGVEALEKLNDVSPDLILLDWDMPVMKGSTALMHIMIRSPGPVIILSGFIGGVGANPFDLICLGAADFMRKPQSKWRTDGRAEDLIRRIKRASEIRFDRIRRVRIPSVLPDKEATEPTRALTTGRFLTVLCSSTGGCADLIRIIPELPPDLKSAVVCIHDMQREAIDAFVDYLNHRSKIIVRKVEADQALEEGVCYLHPATSPIELYQGAGGPTFRMGSVIPFHQVLDHFLTSATQTMKMNILAVLLSGSADLSVDGLREVKKAGGTTMVQDPVTSVDPRLAQVALDQGIVDRTCPADDIVETLLRLIP